jgi:ABC-2 type transport system ATP-binding protein
MIPALLVEDLSKTYKLPLGKEIKAVEDLFLTVPQGTVFGLLGPNGAGKTTTLKSILGFIRPDKGRIRIFGEDHYLPWVRRKVGFLPEQPYFHLHLNALKTLDFYGELFSMKKKERLKRAEKLLQLVGLFEHRTLPLSKFSKGMLQRLGLAQALINDPELLILDEPASGLDPVGQIDIRNVILQLKKEGKTILLSSHLLTEVEKVSDEIAIIDRGKLLLCGKRGELLKEKIRIEINLLAKERKEIPKDISSLTQQILWEDKKLSLNALPENVDQIIDWARKNGFSVLSVVPLSKSLEDLFLEVVRNE